MLVRWNVDLHQFTCDVRVSLTRSETRAGNGMSIRDAESMPFSTWCMRLGSREKPWYGYVFYFGPDNGVNYILIYIIR
jgi:hypothetical protein